MEKSICLALYSQESLRRRNNPFDLYARYIDRYYTSIFSRFHKNSILSLRFFERNDISKGIAIKKDGTWKLFTDEYYTIFTRLIKKDMPYYKACFLKDTLSKILYDSVEPLINKGYKLSYLNNRISHDETIKQIIYPVPQAYRKLIYKLANRRV